MIKLEKMAVAHAALSLAFCLGLIGAFAQDISDSPIDIGGGSIYGYAKNGWKPDPSKAHLYTAQSANIDQISTSGVNVTLPSSLQGWAIKMSSVRKDGSAYPGAVTICSALNSDLSCNINSLGDGHTVFIFVDPQAARWTLTKKGHLRYHLKDCDGNTGELEDPNCDMLVDVTFQSPSIANANHTLTGVCGQGPTEGHCDVGIGK